MSEREREYVDLCEHAKILPPETGDRFNVKTYRDAQLALVLDSGILSCSVSALRDEKLLRALSSGRMQWLDAVTMDSTGSIACKEACFSFHDGIVTIDDLLPTLSDLDIMDTLQISLALFVYAFTGLIPCLLTWFDVSEHADTVRVGNRTELIVSTIAADVATITSVFNWAGILLNNRSFLAYYTGSGKIHAQWSRNLNAVGRLRIQNRLHCCGYYSPFVESTFSQTCYPRSIFPGCKASYLRFERRILQIWYTIVFSLVPLHILITLAELLCSDHAKYRFGKGIMPKAYRLSSNSMAIIMDYYASQLAEQYGPLQTFFLVPGPISDSSHYPMHLRRRA
ncbi:hypothetical protein PISMIDRAFT_12293 [Pisolithus microcarpus 441]|uniref:Unplaced genomic scaffold scaffold_68, whole genome shotgun sequence n=1 Tax=Pisolithus microcarpus 441 TaxID=765257 RepID=A0A0C9ZNG4_9AGAM|nr:hypothetical protein BKA83DRAFT_12293 [Pisolithus microcarpus]KIK21343.1 hypothetical protein PISMIDRAFT_12293 [Pisolithus microcarpus 441]